VASILLATLPFEEATLVTENTEIEEPIENTETALPPLDLPALWSPLDNGIITATKFAVICIGLAFTVLVVCEVASRFVFDQSVSIVNGTARFLLVWFFMIGSSLALRQGGHVALDILSKKLPPVPGAIVYFIAQALTLTFLLQLLWGGYVALNAALPQVEGSLGISMAWAMAAFPTGFLLLIYHQAALVTSTVRKFATKG